MVDSVTKLFLQLIFAHDCTRLIHLSLLYFAHMTQLDIAVTLDRPQWLSNHHFAVA
jgi:hypothetical protein